MITRPGESRVPVLGLVGVCVLLLVAGGTWWFHASASRKLERSLATRAGERTRQLAGHADDVSDVAADLLEAGQRRQSERHRQDLASLLPLVIPDEQKRQQWLAARSARDREDLASRVQAARSLLRASQEAGLRALDRDEPAALAAVVDASAHDMTWSAALLAATVAAAVFVLGVIVWRARVLRPAARLAATMESVAAGADDRIPAGRAGELARPAEAFNRMVDALTAARRELRLEVERQTAALAEGLDEQQLLNRRLKEVLDELREAQARLVKQEKMAALGTLAGGVAHEFNNVLGGIRGCVDEVLEDLEVPAAVESLQVIRRAAERGRRIVEGLLRFSQAAGREPETLDLSAVLRETASLLRHEAEQREVNLEVAPQGSVSVLADPVEIHQVVHNLLLNALQHAPPGSGVEARATAESGRVRLCVADRGPGVARDVGQRIFEPFFTTRESEGGVGLGLAMSHGIVQALGGELGFTDREGGGTTFWLELPEAAEDHGRD